MSSTLPLGRRENEVLEFKAAGVMKDLHDVGREVVAFLNAKGGQLWIGIVETDGVATQRDRIDEVHSEKERLWNHLIETIEPGIDESTVAIEVVDEEGRAGILRIRVTPDESLLPYSQLRRGGARHFFERAGARVRPMSRERIFSMAKHHASEITSKHNESSWIAEAREEALESKQRCLWLGIEPDAPLDVDLRSQGLRHLLAEPTATGNRASGWTFASRFDPPARIDRRLVLGSNGSTYLSLWHDGRIEYTPTIDRLTWLDRPIVIDPLIVAERIVSVLRLASTLYRSPRDGRARPPYANGDGGRTESQTLEILAAMGKKPLPSEVPQPKHVVVDLALGNVQGLYFNPFRHNTAEYYGGGKQLEEATIQLDRPVVAGFSEFVDDPDATAFRLLSRLYDRLGLSDELLPPQFDRRTRRLILKD